MLMKPHMDRTDMACVRHTASHPPLLAAMRVAICMSGRTYEWYAPLRTHVSKRTGALHYLNDQAATYRQPGALHPLAANRMSVSAGDRTSGTCHCIHKLVSEHVVWNYLFGYTVERYVTHIGLDGQASSIIQTRG